METTESKHTNDRSATPVLAGRTMVLRPVAAGDLPLLSTWDQDPAIIALMGRRFTEQTPHDWLAAVQGRRSARAWMIETYDGQVVGEVELAQINWRSASAEIRICIGRQDCWGCGLGTDAMIQSLQFAFDRLNLRSVYLRVFTTNTRAVRLYQRLGFRREAILQPSSRRQDPAPVLLMNLSRARWVLRREAIA